jgi:YVTN family beta-propeller protein
MPRSSFRAAAGLALLGLALAGCGGDPSPVLPVTAAYTDLDAQTRDLVAGFDPGTLWVSGYDVDQVFEVDPAAHVVRRTLHVRSGPGGLVPDPARRSLYCLHLKENAISLIGGSPTAVERSLATGDISLASGALRPDADELWICDGTSKLHILVPKAMSLKASWPVGRYPQKLAFSPDGRQAWVTLKGENLVVVLDADSHRELARIPVGIYPRDILWAKGTVCVTNNGSDDVSLLDASRLRERVRIKVRAKPSGLALRGRTLWVACEDSYRLMAIDLVQGRVIGSVKTGFYPGALLALADGTLVVADPRGRRLAFLTPTQPEAPR